MLGNIKSAVEGDFSRPPCQGIRVDDVLLKAVYYLIALEWENTM